MAGIGQNRVFDKAAIAELKIQVMELMACAIEVTEEIKTEMADLLAVAEEVPEEARYAPLAASAQALMDSLDTGIFQQMQISVTETLDKLCAQIPAYDRESGGVLTELAASTHSLKGKLEDLTAMINQGNLKLSLEEFQGKLTDYETRWNSGILTLSEKMELAMTYLKGLVLTSQFSKDPVNLATGNLYYEKEDLRIGGPLPLTFCRCYNALDRQSGSLGPGWSHNHEILLTFGKKDREIITLHKADGKEVTFRREEGNYRDIHTGRETIEQVQDTYRYREPVIGAYFFDQEGKLTRFRKEEGPALAYTYDETGKLTKTYLETETEGEEAPYISYTYNKDGLLKEVTDHTGRKIEYFHMEGRLCEVTDPEGNVTTYRYGENRKMRAIKNPRGTLTVRNEYDEKNRVIRQRFPDKGEIRYDYRETQNTTILTERNGSTITYIQDDRLRNIKTIYPDGEERAVYNDRDQKILTADRRGNETRYAYDDKGNLKEQTNALGETTHYTYNTQGKLLSIQKADKKVLKNRYDETGRLIHTGDALGRETHITYNEKGGFQTITQPDQSRIHITYDRLGNIQTITDPMGGETRYTYDALNRVNATTDPEGNTTHYTYDGCDRIRQVTDPQGNHRSYTYNESGKITQTIDFDGSITEQEYNTINKPSLLRDAAGYETRFSYDLMWNLKEKILPNGAILTYQYDPLGRLCAQTDAEGNTTAYQHDPAGNPTATVAANGETTRYAYDPLNRLVKVTEPHGAETTYTYDREGRLAAQTDAEGNTTTYAYDDADQKILETDALGNTTRYTYTPMGKTASVTDPRGRKTAYEYYPGGLLKRTIHPDGTFEELTYDNNQNIATRTDHLGQTFTYRYDPLGRLTAVKSTTGEEQTYTYDAAGNMIAHQSPGGTLTKYSYDSLGSLTAVTDPLGNQALYTYDSLGNLTRISQKDGETGAEQQTLFGRNLSGQVIKITSPQGETKHCTYDPCGRLLSQTDQEGYETTYRYAPCGEIETITYGDGSTVAFSYNALRQLITVKDWLGETQMERDALGRPVKVTDHLGRKVSYEWEPNGNRRSLTYPDGEKISYTYDPAGHLTGLTGNRINLNCRYDSLGRLIEKDYGNGTRSIWEYYPTGLPSELRHEAPQGILDRFRYTYDTRGNKTATEKYRREAQEENGTYEYTYDPLGRLLTVGQDHIPVRRYTYDAYGNRKEMEDYRKGSRTCYQYDAVNRLIQEQDTTGNHLQSRTYTYDKRGNLTQIHQDGNLTQGYEYGALNRLTHAWNGKGESARYEYNGLGYRTARNEAAYLLDLTKPYHNLLGIQEGEETKTFYLDGSMAVMEESGNSPGERPVLHYCIPDEQGSPLRLLDEQGSPVETYGYDEYGNDLYGNQGKRQPFGYTGYLYDPISATYHAQAREYQPQTGRFTAQDGEDYIHPYRPESLNLYTYCACDPLNRIDPTGHDCFDEEGEEEADWKKKLKELLLDKNSNSSLFWYYFSIYSYLTDTAYRPWRPGQNVINTNEGGSEIDKADLFIKNGALTLEEMQVNARYIQEKLREMGWSENAIIACLANWEVECKINPGQWQNNSEGNMNLGFGLAQWTPASKYFDWANENNLDPYDIDTQLQCIQAEVNGEMPDWYSWQDFRHESNISFEEFTQSEDMTAEELTEIYMLCHERPAEKNRTPEKIEERKDQAEKWKDF